MVVNLFDQKETQSVGLTFDKGADKVGLFSGTQPALAEIYDFQKQNGNLKGGDGWNAADQLFGVYAVDLANSRPRKSASPDDLPTNMILSNRNEIVSDNQDHGQADSKFPPMQQALPKDVVHSADGAAAVALGKGASEFKAWWNQPFSERKPDPVSSFIDGELSRAATAVVDGVKHGIGAVEDAAVNTGKWMLDHPGTSAALVGAVATEAVVELATFGMATPVQLALGAMLAGSTAHELWGRDAKESSAAKEPKEPKEAKGC